MGTTTTTVKRTVTKVQRAVPEWWDVPVLIVVFAGLLLLAQGYAPSARQFPVTFLGAGLLFMIVQLLSEVLPGKYGEALTNLSEGMTSDFNLDMDEELKDDGGAGDEREARSLIVDDRAKVVVMALNVLLMFVASYFIGFLFAIPIFAALSVWSVGSAKFSNFALITILLMVTVYLLFGEVMNVPITEGVWIDI